MKEVDGRAGNLDVNWGRRVREGEKKECRWVKGEGGKAGGQYAEQIRASDGNSVAAPLLLLFRDE